MDKYSQKFSRKIKSSEHSKKTLEIKHYFQKLRG